MAGDNHKIGLQMLKRALLLEKGADRSVHAYGAVVLCFIGMMFGGFAIRSHREEEMMRTMPEVGATVLSLEARKNGYAAWIAFTKIVNGHPVACKTQIALSRRDGGLRIGSVVRVIPRLDSCGEPVIPGERDTSFLVILSGTALVASLALGVVAALSMLRSGHAKAME